MSNMYKTITSLIIEMDILKLWIKIDCNKEQIPNNSQGEVLDAYERYIM